MALGSDARVYPWVTQESQPLRTAAPGMEVDCPSKTPQPLRLGPLYPCSLLTPPSF